MSYWLLPALVPPEYGVGQLAQVVAVLAGAAVGKQDPVVGHRRDPIVHGEVVAAAVEANSGRHLRGATDDIRDVVVEHSNAGPIVNQNSHDARVWTREERCSSGRRDLVVPDDAAGASNEDPEGSVLIGLDALNEVAEPTVQSDASQE